MGTKSVKGLLLFISSVQPAGSDRWIDVWHDDVPNDKLQPHFSCRKTTRDLAALISLLKLEEGTAPSTTRPASFTLDAMPRRAKSHSVSSDTPPTSRSPPPKLSAPVTTEYRRSPPSPPINSTYDAVADPVRKSKIASGLRFPLVVILSFTFSSLLFSIVAEVSAGDLAAISKHTESWVEITGLLGWKVVQLAVCWFGGLDGVYGCRR